jgi:hypothetical protein
MIQLKMRNKFERLFKQDEDGLPKRFGPKDDIHAHWKKACDATLKMLGLFSIYVFTAYDLTDDCGEMLTNHNNSHSNSSSSSNNNSATNKPSKANSQPSTPTSDLDTATAQPAEAKDDTTSTKQTTTKTAEEKEADEHRKKQDFLRKNPDQDPNNIIISETMRDAKKKEFIADAENILRQAEDELIRLNNNSKMPMWQIALIAFLGFDEFMSVLTNPLLMIFLVFLGALGYMIYVLNLGGPVKLVLGKVMEVANQSFTSYLTQPAPRRPTTTTTTNSDDDELKASEATDGGSQTGARSLTPTATANSRLNRAPTTRRATIHATTPAALNPRRATAPASVRDA